MGGGEDNSRKQFKTQCEKTLLNLFNFCKIVVKYKQKKWQFYSVII